MYIEPFWCGVVATVLVELAAVIAYEIYASWKGKK